VCLIVLAHGVSAAFPFVLAANRDEFYARPTRPVHRWDEDPRVRGGRDLRAGGSWLAIRDDGRFAAVTNVRGARMEGGPSRGALVADFVKGDADPLDYARGIRGDDYAGFHLIAGVAGKTIAHVSNEGAPASLIEPGIFAVSNGRPGDDWPKVQLAREAMAAALAGDAIEERLFAFLTAAGAPASSPAGRAPSRRPSTAARRRRASRRDGGAPTLRIEVEVFVVSP